MTSPEKVDSSNAIMTIGRHLASLAFDIASLWPYLTKDQRTKVGMWLSTVAETCLIGEDLPCNSFAGLMRIVNATISSAYCEATQPTSCSAEKLNEDWKNSWKKEIK